MTSRMFSNGYSGKEPGFQKMILLSLIVHFIVITIIFVSVPTASRHLTFGPVYSVSLVSSNVVLSRNQESSLLKEIEKSGEAVSSVIYKKEINRSASTPVKKEEANKLNIEKAISAIKQREQAVSEPSSSSSRLSSGNRPARMASGEITAKTNDYANFVSSRVHNNWSIPPELKPRGNIETVIEIKIMRDGTLAYAGFEKRSGNRFYDDSAMKAVKKSSPFPPLPEGFSGSIMEIGIRFHPSQLR
ncbi:MAG: energy transducer TonB [Smithellaceae bacterium]